MQNIESQGCHYGLLEQQGDVCKDNERPQNRPKPLQAPGANSSPAICSAQHILSDSFLGSRGERLKLPGGIRQPETEILQKSRVTSPLTSLGAALSSRSPKFKELGTSTFYMNSLVLPHPLARAGPKHLVGSCFKAVQCCQLFLAILSAL